MTIEAGSGAGAHPWLHAILQISPDGVIILDQNDTIRAVGRGTVEIFGYPAEEMIGRAISQLMAIDGESDGAPGFGNGRPIDGRRKDGTTFPLEVALGTTSGAGDRRVRALVVRDVTQCARRDACGHYAAVKEANRELDHFAHITSHDLQEPLRMVSGYLDLLLRRHADELSEEARRFVSNASDGALRMRDLLEALLAYARVPTRGGPFEVIDLAEVVAEARRGLSGSIEAAEADVQCHGLARQICADFRQMVQLFRHLLANAIKFRHPERRPVIRIGAEAEHARTRIYVADNGIGIEPRFAEQIFGVFRRLHTRGEYPGTGIGLAICRRIVDRHGGQIHLDPSPSEGATFWLTLPGPKGSCDG